MKRILILLSWAVSGIGLSSPTYAMSSTFDSHVKAIADSTHLSQKIIKLALKGYEYAHDRAHISKNVLTIVDYSQPSFAKRLYVIDLNTNKLLMNTWVAHGRNTGTAFSTHFSNQLESKQSSIGVFITEGTYNGHHGESMVLNGLEKDINNNAKNRHLVVHAAPYVSEVFLKETGRLGRSFGCLAVNAKDLTRLIELTRDGSVIFAYAPQEDNDQVLATI